jgi:predicted TPR repeat methyltransferase
MSTDDVSIDDKSWLRTPLTDPVDIASRYDQWAPTYEKELVEDWDYDAPFEAARLMAERGVISPVLDIGCGIGLTGRALRSAGFTVIDGIDISEVSMAVARASGAYRNLVKHDFNEAPLPFADDSYAAAECIGVMSYALEPKVLLADMCRVVKTDGTIIFTHRTDLWDEHDFPSVLHRLCVSGKLLDVIWSDPKPYIPGHADFGDRVLVRYVTATVA